MKKVTKVGYLFFLVAILTLRPSNVLAYDLGELFKKAKNVSELGMLVEAKEDQANSTHLKNKANYYPKVSLKGTYTKYDQLSDSKSNAVSLTQNIYKGGKDYFTVQSSEINKQVSLKEVSALEQMLYMDLINAYFTHWLNLAELKNVELLKDLSQKRRNEIKSRVNIGRSRRGELLQGEAQLATVEASVVNLRGAAEESLKKLVNIVGTADISFDEIKNEGFTKIEVKSLNDYLNEGLGRDELKAKELKLEAYEFDLKAAKRSHFPTVDLASNYYLTKRTGTFRNSDWDLALTLSIPLFEGFSSTATINETIAKKMEAQYAKNLELRKIKTDIEVKYESVKKYRDQLSLGYQAFELSKANYNESLKDYRLGLVTNLDTLTALNTYLDSKRTFDKMQIESFKNLELLKASAGYRP